MATTVRPGIVPHSHTHAAPSGVEPRERPASPPTLGTQIIHGIYNVGVTTAAGAMAGYAFSFINPIGGAIFGATTGLADTIANSLAERFAFNSTAVKIAVWAVSAVVSIGLGLLAVTAAGFPLTVVGSVGMTVAMIVTGIAVKIVTVGVVCCSACIGSCAGGAALAVKEKLC